MFADAGFTPALLSVLEVLPVGTAFSSVELPGGVAGAGSDFEALEKLRRLAFSEQVEAPRQLESWVTAVTMEPGPGESQSAL